MNKTILTLTILGLLQGCAATKGQRDAFARQQDIADRASEAQQQMASAKGNEAYYEVVDGVWLGSRSASRPVDALPPELRAPVDRPSAAALTVPEIAAWIERHYGVQVRLAEDALAAPAIATTISVPHSGTVASYLDAVTARAGVSWRWTGDAAEIFIRETRTYQFDALSFATDLDNTITNVNASSSGGGQSGGTGSSSGAQTGLSVTSGQTTTLKASIDPFEALVKDIEAIVTKSGGTVIANRFLSSVTVTDTPVIHARIKRYIDDANAIATKQVQFAVKVLSVELDANESYGINWGMVYQDLTSRFGIQTQLVSDAINSSNTATISLLNPSSRFDGSQVILEALSAQGDVSIEQSANVITLNGRPAPIQVTEDTAYLPSVTSLQVPNAGATTSFQGATVTTGFAMRLTPMVRQNNDVIVQMELNLSNLRNLRQISPGLGLTAEQPEVDRRQIAPQVLLKSGATMVLSGFEQTRASGNRRGMGSPGFQALGGGTNTAQRKTTMVVLITPVVL